MPDAAARHLPERDPEPGELAQVRTRRDFTGFEARPFTGPAGRQPDRR